ncbi:MAG: LCP family protein [Turicibacter sp.]|nr:LCP family protein [Turicibacter sp.]
MSFLKKSVEKNWLKILFFLPSIPIVWLVMSLDRFTGIDGFLRLLVSMAIVLLYLFLIFSGSYFSINKRKIGKGLVVLLTVGFFFGTTYGAVMAHRVSNVLDIVTERPLERGYSLVAMAGFDAETLNGYGRTGVLTNVATEISEARIIFLEGQSYIPNPITTDFASPTALLEALYAGEVDTIIITSNFVRFFEDEVGFENIEFDTVVLGRFDVTIEREEREVLEPGEPFSLLILGLDSHQAGELDYGRIDTIMLATFNIDELSFTLTSVPRDGWVMNACSFIYDRLAHATAHGDVDCAVRTVENLFDMEIPYYVLVNMTGVVDVVNELGGVEVDVPFTFDEQDSRRRTGPAYRIFVEQGLQVLDGEQALALIRHRDTLANDFQRSENTQLVLEAMIREMVGSLSSVSDAVNLLEVLSLNMRTNMTTHEITALAQYLVEFLPSTGMNDLMNEVHVMSMAIIGHDMYVDESSVVVLSQLQIEEARRIMMINLGLEEPPFILAFDFNGFDRRRINWLPYDYFGNGIITPTEPALPHDPWIPPVDPGMPDSSPPTDQPVDRPPADEQPPTDPPVPPTLPADQVYGNGNEPTEAW